VALISYDEVTKLFDCFMETSGILTEENFVWLYLVLHKSMKF